MKKISCILVLFLCTIALFATDIKTTIEISKIDPSAGTIFIAIFDSKEALKENKPIQGFVLEAEEQTLITTVSLPVGEYYVSVFQDINNNKQLDTNFIGIPKEPVGISNYSGSGIPGGFDKHKVLINTNNSIITIVMAKI